MWFWAIALGLLSALASGALTFGEEFEQRTLSGLLCQPRTRWALYLQKLAPLAAVLAWIAANLSLGLAAVRPSSGPSVTVEHVAGIWGGALLVFCSAPLYTLITRSTLAGAIFVVAAPLALVMMGALAGFALERWGGVEGAGRRLEEGMWWMAPAYALLCAGLGWRHFARLEVPDGRAGPALSHPFSLPVDRLLKGILPKGSWVHVVRKELRLHVVPWLVAGIFTGVWLLWMGIRALMPADEGIGDFDSAWTGFLGVLAVLMGLLSLLVSGAACVAEERQLGTLDWQLTQPLSLSRQWWIKLAVAFGLFVVLGIALPLGLLGLAFGREMSPGDWSPELPLILGCYAAAIVLLFALAAYASSFCRSTMKASATAVVLGLALGALPFPVVALTGVRMDAIAREAESVQESVPGWAPAKEVIQWTGIGGLMIAGLVLLGLLLWLGRRNFCRTDVPESALFRQWLLLGAVLLGSLLLVSETVLQFTRLRVRADTAEWRAQRGAQADSALRELVHWQMDHGGLDAGVLGELRLDPGASRDAIVEALTGIPSVETREAWVESLFRLATAGPAASAGSSHRMGALLGLRYGMSITNLIQQRLRETASPPSGVTTPHRLDPVLQERYRLVPGGQPPSAPVPQP